MNKARLNYMLDAVIGVAFVISAATGMAFLLMGSGGYQGGRNPMYGVQVLFERHTWSDLHLWGGVLMIAAILVHFSIHWAWVKRMSRRTASILFGEARALSRGSRVNVAINLIVAVSFLICALSGVYFVFASANGFQGGHNAGWDPGFLFSRTTWDLIHTWSGVVMGAAAMVHFAIHWRWVKNVTARFFLSLAPQPGAGVGSVSSQPALPTSKHA